MIWPVFKELVAEAKAALSARNFQSIVSIRTLNVDN